MVAKPINGSSPLTRGKPPLPVPFGNVSRLIPAHAGKTVDRPQTAPPGSAHPRSRGENPRDARFPSRDWGSSPLTRGKLPSQAGTRPVPRLIPAHAGKTRPLTPIARSRPAHPRSRGENQVFRCNTNEKSGSSPLTRGKRLTGAGGATGAGLIPAHAGKTRRDAHLRDAPRAHPRSRGENRASPMIQLGGDGSSPLTRGKPDLGAYLEMGLRLIPAHAGKTLSPPAPTTVTWAHPRSRGENSNVGPGAPVAFGSSPLTRGKHFPTCAFTAQIDQILETLELAVSSGSYSVWVACATDAPQDQVRSIGLVLPSSRGAS